METIDVSIDTSFSQIWGETNIQLNSILDVEYCLMTADQVGRELRLATTDVVLTTTSNLKEYQHFEGLIFCYQDELLDISSYLETSNIFTFPESFEHEEVKRLIVGKLERWIEHKVEENIELLARNIGSLRSTLKKKTPNIKESEVKQYLKLKSLLDKGELKEGVLPICNRKIKYKRFTDLEFSKHVILPNDFLVYSNEDGYSLISINDNDKWVEKNISLVTLLIDLIHHWEKEQENQGHILSFLIDSLEGLPFPMAILSVDRELVLSNHKFLNLSISLASLVSQRLEQIRIKGETYHLKKMNFQVDDELFDGFFFFKQDINTNDTNFYSDLGIICSSLAHELKNPLAGILAALNVLEISDSLDEDSMDYLDTMKETTMRAKSLIETFLGFSRFNIGKKNHENSDENFKNISIKQAFKQASSLTKERAIESCTDIRFSYEDYGTVEFNLNESVMLMVFYLIFNEAITSFTHKKLVGDEESFLEINCMEGVESLTIAITPWVDNLVEHKLINHLINMQSMRASFGEGYLKLTRA